MKVYTLDHSYDGSVVVIAETKEQALELMKNEHPRTDDNDFARIEEHEILCGFSFSNFGDM